MKLDVALNIMHDTVVAYEEECLGTPDEEVDEYKEERKELWEAYLLIQALVIDNTF